MTRNRLLRRQAVHIVAQLPPDQDDALAILKYAAEFVNKFLEDEPLTPRLHLVQNLAELPCQFDRDACPVAKVNPVER